MLVHHLRILALQEEKIPGFVPELQRLPLQNAVRVHDDVALLSLPEDFLECNTAESFRFHHILQHTSRPHTGKLVNISHHNQPCSRANRIQQGMKEKQIHHRHFIDDNYIRLQRMINILLKPPFLPCTFTILLWSVPHRLIPKQTMDGHGLVPGCFRHALRRAAGGCCEQHRFHIGKEQANDGVDRRCFACTGAAADQQNASAGGKPDRFFLQIIQCYVLVLLDMPNPEIQLLLGKAVCILCVQIQKAACDVLFHAIGIRGIYLRHRSPPSLCLLRALCFTLRLGGLRMSGFEPLRHADAHLSLHGKILQLNLQDLLWHMQQRFRPPQQLILRQIAASIQKIA